LKSNDAKRAVITDLLGTDDVPALAGSSVAEWNEHFGASPVPSTMYIQSPARWSLRKFDAHIASNDDFRRTCRFKWSFNIKPDLVIHTDNDHAVCIEAKYASGEGQYPGNEAEKAIFKRRKLGHVNQTDLQHEMLTRLLGVECMFVFLV
jgi:hypothetical protein